MKHSHVLGRLTLALCLLLTGCGQRAAAVPTPTPAASATASPPGAAPAGDAPEAEASSLNWLPYAPSEFAAVAGAEGLGDAAAFAPAGDICPQRGRFLPVHRPGGRRGQPLLP